MTRKHLIGGTDAATLLGVGRESRLHLYMRLRGEIPNEEPDNEDALKAGKLAEDGLIRPLVEDLIDTNGEGALVRAAPVPLQVDPRIGVSPDFYASNGRDVEAKLTGSRLLWGTHESRQVPLHVYLQVQFQYAVPRDNGMPRHAIDVWTMFLPSYDLCRYPIPEDIEVGKKLIEAAHEMLRRVDAGLEPEATNEEDARAKFLAYNEEPIELSAEQQASVKRIGELSRIMREAKAESDDLRNQLLPQLGNASVLIGAGGEVVATWRANRVFDEVAFARKHPDILAQYTVPKLDMAAVRKHHKKAVEACMVMPTHPSEQTRVFKVKGGDD